MQDVKIRKEKLDRHFNPILNKWIQMLNKYNDTFTENPPLYSYGERATVSTLAGAVWKCDYYALEEVRSHKSNDIGQYTGWIDLGILCDNPKAGYFIEAKQIFEIISPPASMAKVINNISFALKKARAAIESPRNSESLEQIVDQSSVEFTGIGAVFITPRISFSCPDEKATSLITELIEQLETVEYDILGYTFPLPANRVESEIGDFFAGVILLAIAD